MKESKIHEEIERGIPLLTSYIENVDNNLPYKSVIQNLILLFHTKKEIINPFLQKAYQLRGECHRKLGKFLKATNDITEAANYDKRIPVYFSLKSLF